MAIVLPSSYQDILAKIQESAKKSYWEWELEFVADGKVVKADKVIEYDEFADYASKYSSVISVSVMMVMDMYQRFLYPKRKNMTAVVRKKPLLETRSDERDEPYEIRYYRVIPFNNNDVQTQQSLETDPTLGLGRFTFQLEELSIYELMHRTAGTIARKELAADVLRALLGSAVEKLKLPMDQRVKGITMVPPNVVEPKDHLIIEHGTPLLELPGYMQLHCGGIYNAQMGTFIDNGMWYIYPIYDIEQYPKAERVMDLILLPENRTMGMDRTYMKVGHRLFVAITGQVGQADTSDLDYLRYGNGTRFINGTKSFADSAKVEGNRATMDANSNTSHIAIDEREDSFQSAPFSSSKITDNVAAEISKMAPRRGQILSLMWNFSNHLLLKPGMPVKLHYPIPGGTKEVHGTLLSAQTHVSSADGKMTGKRYVSATNLRVFVQK